MLHVGVAFGVSFFVGPLALVHVCAVVGLLRWRTDGYRITGGWLLAAAVHCLAALPLGAFVFVACVVGDGAIALLRGVIWFSDEDELDRSTLLNVTMSPGGERLLNALLWTAEFLGGLAVMNWLMVLTDETAVAWLACTPIHWFAARRAWSWVGATAGLAVASLIFGVERGQHPDAAMTASVLMVLDVVLMVSAERMCANEIGRIRELASTSAAAAAL